MTDASHSPRELSGDPDASAHAAPPDRGAGGATGDGWTTQHGDPDLRTLRRARHGRMVGGVAAGVADFLGVDVTVVRVVAVVFGLMGGLAVPVYLALWVLVPEEGTDRSILSHFVPGAFGPRTVPATEAVPAQGGAAMSPCPPFSEPTEEHRWQASTGGGPGPHGPGPQWYGGWPGSRWRAPWTDTGQSMRIGDAERSQVSEVLSKHYAAGRLDDEEFNQRMGQAMGAKTRSDLSGLLSDLPATEPTDKAPAHRHRFGLGRIVMVGLAIFVAASIASWVWAAPHVFRGAWILLAVAAFFVLRWERHRNWHRAHGD